MIPRRALYVILSVSCMPLFWVGAMDQQRLVSTHELGDVAEHFALAMMVRDAVVFFWLTLMAAIALSLVAWQESPPRVQLQIGAWFAVLAVCIAAAFITSAPAVPASVDERITAGWIELGLLGTLVVLPAAYLSLSFRRRQRPAVGDVANE